MDWERADTIMNNYLLDRLFIQLLLQQFLWEMKRGEREGTQRGTQRVTHTVAMKGVVEKIARSKKTAAII